MSSNADIFNQVRAAVDIVEIIGEHIALKKAGREFKGLCPFHPDHRPSMSVVPHKQIFHCFVCGTGGDVFKFVKEFHKMGNGEALRMLAQRGGIKLPDLPPSGRGGGSGGGAGTEKGKDGLTVRERIAATNEWACTWFEKQLRSPLGKTGLDYFYSRGLTDETIARFRLGFAPDGWTGMVNAALRGGIANEALFEAGLIKQRADSSPYDAFRNRVIFPIIDATGGSAMGAKGRVIAFGGRILVEKRDEAGNVTEAKYLNSPDSKLFNKSESLYGLNLARQQIIRTRTAVVVEGYMDVIACHQRPMNAGDSGGAGGVTNVIATLGTALTADHARILKNYAQTIVLIFDSDDAGRRATDRALDVFVRGSLDIKLASVPDGKDPCDFCMKNGGGGGEAFQKIIDGATDALAYKWEKVKAQMGATSSVSAQQEAATEFMRFVAPVFEAMTDPVRRGLMLAKLGGLVRMKPADVQEMLKRYAKQGATQYKGASAAAASGPQSPESASVEQGGSAPGEVAGESAAEPPPPPVNIRALKGLEAAEGWLLGALLVRPLLYESLREDMALHLFRRFEKLAAKLMELLDNHSELHACTLAELTSSLEDEGVGGGGGGGELARQAIELEEKTADWLEPANLSPQHAKLLQHLTADRGLNLEKLARESLAELHADRGKNSAVEAEFGEKPIEPQPGEDADLADAMKQIAAIKAKNSGGGNRRVTG